MTELLGLVGSRRSGATVFSLYPAHAGHPPLAQRRRECCFEAPELEEVGWRYEVRRLRALVSHVVKGLHIEPLSRDCASAR